MSAREVEATDPVERAAGEPTPTPTSEVRLLVRPEPASRGARELAHHLGVSTTLGDVLFRAGHRDAAPARRFLEPKLADLTQPDGMADRGVAADRLARAVRSRERVVVFGDYDCDGMTATAILCEGLRALGGTATPLLASRFDGGYGLSPAALVRVLSAEPGLVVTCDCGSSDHATLAQLRRAGVDVVVIDHHLVPTEPLPVLAFLNPHRPECAFGYKHLASCGLALSVVAALRAELRRELDLKPLLDLVAIGTIADVAPLTGDNRALVRAGLERVRTAERPGIAALNALARLGVLTPVSGEDVAFKLAPRLNAPGRMGPPDLALELLLAQTASLAEGIAARMEQLTEARRALTQTMLDEAEADVRASGDDQAAIVVGREGWNHGVVGIVAGRLADRLARPTIAIGFEHGVGRGSVRGPRGARLYDALAQVSDVLERFGGHQAAAGLEVRIERLAELRTRFAAAVAAQGPAPAATPLGDGAVWLDAGDEPARVARDLRRLEPCGEGNPAPKIMLDARVISARAVKGGHLKLELDLGNGRRLAAFGVTMGDRAEGATGAIVALGRLRPDTWRGGDAVELKLEALAPANA